MPLEALNHSYHATAAVAASCQWSQKLEEQREFLKNIFRLIFTTLLRIVEDCWSWFGSLRVMRKDVKSHGKIHHIESM